MAGDAPSPTFTPLDALRYAKMAYDYLEQRKAEKRAQELAEFNAALSGLQSAGVDPMSLYSTEAVSQALDSAGWSQLPGADSGTLSRDLISDLINLYKTNPDMFPASEQAQSASKGEVPQDYPEVPRDLNLPQDVIEGTYTDQTGTIWGYDAAGNKWKIYEPMTDTVGGEGSSSSSVGGGSEAGVATTGGVEDPATAGSGDTIGENTQVVGEQLWEAVGAANDPAFKSAIIREFENYTGTKYDPNKRYGGPATNTAVGPADVFSVEGTSQPSTVTQPAPTGTQSRDWLTVISDLLKNKPNTTIEEVITLSGAPRDIVDQVLAAQGTTGTTGTGTTGTGTTGTGTTGTGTTGTGTTGTGTTGTGTTGTGTTGTGDGTGDGDGGEEQQQLGASPTQQQYRTVNVEKAPLADIDYLYDIGGESIFAPTLKNEDDEILNKLQYYSGGQIGRPPTIEELLQILRG